MQNVSALLNEVDATLQSGDHARALALLESALNIGAAPEHILPTITKYFNARQLSIAARMGELTLQFYPSHYNLLNTLGVVLKNQTRYNEAIKVLKQAIAINPNEVMAWINLGNVYMLIEQVQEALGCFDNVVAIRPCDAEAMRLQASAHIRLGDSGRAESILRKAIIYGPENKGVLADLSAACYNQQCYDQALEYVERCLHIVPNNLELLKRKAMILQHLGRRYDSIAIHENIREINPKDIDNLLSLGHGYHTVLGRSEKAKECYDAAYAIDPTNSEVLQRLCEFLLSIKKPDGSQDEFIAQANEYAEQLMATCKSVKSIASLMQAISLKLLDYDRYSKLGSQKELIEHWVSLYDSRPFVFNLSRVKTMEDRLRLLEAHRICGANVEKKATAKLNVTKVRQRFNKKIRMGIMSSDLRKHPVGYFAWPLIESLDRSKFEVYCYSFFPYEIDSVQKEVIRRVDSFKNYREESDLLIAESIANDHLDILFELGGRTLLNRTDACAYKPAPVQVSWLGYPHSLGFPTAIDYIVVDPYLTPEDSNLLLEKPFMMPKTWVAIDKIGFVDFPINDSIPQDRNGYVTFGTMNASHKITLESLAVWAEIMNAVPNSRFLYVRPEADSKILRSNFCKHMAQHGISADRISFAATHTDHMQYYNEIDIALDTFPHTGGTTTCETLWMGVPVVTLVGPGFFERLSYSNLSNAGVKDLCAFNLKEYVKIALRLAADRARRLYLRHNLRNQIMVNPLGQSQQFVRDFAGVVCEVLGKN